MIFTPGWATTVASVLFGTTLLWWRAPQAPFVTFVLIWGVGIVPPAVMNVLPLTDYASCSERSSHGGYGSQRADVDYPAPQTRTTSGRGFCPVGWPKMARSR